MVPFAGTSRGRVFRKVVPGNCCCCCCCCCGGDVEETTTPTASLSVELPLQHSSSADLRQLSSLPTLPFTMVVVLFGDGTADADVANGGDAPTSTAGVWRPTGGEHTAVENSGSVSVLATANLSRRSSSPCLRFKVSSLGLFGRLLEQLLPFASPLPSLPRPQSPNPPLLLTPSSLAATTPSPPLETVDVAPSWSSEGEVITGGNCCDLSQRSMARRTWGGNKATSGG